MLINGTMDPTAGTLPGIAIVSSLFPSSAQPTAGLFIRERMFRLREDAALVVVSPQPWFPFQGLIRRFKPGYRPVTPTSEVQQGVTVLFPRFLALPGLLRRLDGLSMALRIWPLMRRLKAQRQVGIIDAHFAYPCGYAAVLLGGWLGLPTAVTLRGTEGRHLQSPGLRGRVIAAVRGATQVFSVSDSLRRLFAEHGIPANRIQVVGNGVDLAKFRRVPQATARAALGLPQDAPVIVTVGGLVERKGFHRVLERLPTLLTRFPGLIYLIVGGPSPEGDMGESLRAQVHRMGMDHNVVFTGPLPAEELYLPLNAADAFVLATSNEGWANVFLEAMACGLPVVTTDVGGNAEVVSSPQLGFVVPFGDPAALEDAVAQALSRSWDRDAIVAYAQDNTWDRRIAVLREQFRRIASSDCTAEGRHA
jgi:teichuronic acid biosynthesis glycosyltransferase TuaC